MTQSFLTATLFENNVLKLPHEMRIKMNKRRIWHKDIFYKLKKQTFVMNSSGTDCNAIHILHVNHHQVRMDLHNHPLIDTSIYMCQGCLF